MKNFKWADLPWYAKAIAILVFIATLPLIAIVFLPAFIVAAVAGLFRRKPLYKTGN